MQSTPVSGVRCRSVGRPPILKPRLGMMLTEASQFREAGDRLQHGVDALFFLRRIDQPGDFGDARLRHLDQQRGDVDVVFQQKALDLLFQRQPLHGRHRRQAAGLHGFGTRGLGDQLGGQVDADLLRVDDQIVEIRGLSSPFGRHIGKIPAAGRRFGGSALWPPRGSTPSDHQIAHPGRFMGVDVNMQRAAEVAQQHLAAVAQDDATAGLGHAVHHGLHKIEIQLRPAVQNPVEQPRLLFVQAHQIFGTNTEPKGFFLQALVVEQLEIERLGHQSGNDQTRRSQFHVKS